MESTSDVPSGGASLYLEVLEPGAGETGGSSQGQNHAYYLA